MIIRFRVPLLLQLFVAGPTRESLDLSVHFSHKKLDCKMSVIGDPNDEPFVVDQVPEDSKHTRVDKYLALYISENPPDSSLQALVETDSYEELAKILRPIVNRCIRALRNFGRIPHVHELYGSEDENHEGVLRRWNVELIIP
jgi:hypothetical protein